MKHLFPSKPGEGYLQKYEKKKVWQNPAIKNFFFPCYEERKTTRKNKKVRRQRIYRKREKEKEKERGHVNQT